MSAHDCITERIWYGDVAQEKGIELALQLCKLPSQENVLDSGCGNGTQLLELYEAGFVNITGADYSPSFYFSSFAHYLISFPFRPSLHSSPPSLFLLLLFSISISSGTMDAIPLHRSIGS
jgi:SAM-dependent methyltransferase